MSTVVWSHDVERDGKIPVELVKPWLEANGDASGRTVKFEILADGDGTLRWWQLDVIAGFLVQEGPFMTPLRVPLPPEMAQYGQSTL